jgi:hypothetical protein
MIELRDQDNTLLLSVPDNPQAAECCTELGCEDDSRTSLMPLAVAAVAVVLLIAVGLALT